MNYNKYYSIKVYSRFKGLMIIRKDGSLGKVTPHPVYEDEKTVFYTHNTHQMDE